MTTVDPPAHDERLDAALKDLAAEFAGVFGSETVGACLTDSYRALLPARIHGYLPVLAYRFARERLTAAARAVAPEAHPQPLVLFVCTGNSGRSIMAAALMAQAASGRVHAVSAGTSPAAEVQPEVLTALQELGAGAGEAFPKPLSDEVVTNADIVVTMGCGDSCPVVPGRRYLDWDVADPAGHDLQTIRSIRDDIAHRVTALLAELVDGPSHTTIREQ
ncbi:low molecular weight phosphatase family protein [Actinopolymorpha rutila]|uniref:Protein-tyrosine-phosphatase n=1 Tax=Actinopolymorpha rutila TaxID=446787 RepID=A0A852ZNM1_9ACTN|nr:arsenate reductase ArsC [Actinopolymorpha rutila]NYH91069.1 protein-tyrosine-phosphatase [Actinopolymorpha rutila]